MSTEPLPFYGGQAVIEGVMMRGRHAVAVAVRAPDGEIVLHTRPLNPIYRSAFARLPFLRGLLGLWDALGLGWESLNYSANVAGGEEAKIEGPMAWALIALTVVFAIGLFSVAPAAVAYWTANVLSLPHWLGALLEGAIQLALLIGYMWAIGQTPDIRRVFGYHGAEHKTINAYEAGAELKPDVVANYPIEHPRCGTAFMLTFVLLSVLVHSALGDQSIVWRLASRILLIPVIAGIAVEYIRWTANHLDSPIVRLLIKPNLALQSLTTRQPDASMLEVAIESFKTMRRAEQEFIA